MKQHVTVVPSDNLIIVEGEALRFTFESTEGIHAIQWHNGSGHIEVAGQNNIALNAADYAEKVEPFVTLWKAERARLDAEAAAANKPENVHIREVMAARSQAQSVLMAKTQATMLQTESFTPQDFSLFATAELFHFWTVGEMYTAGQRIQHEGVVYEIIQDVTALENQPPNAEGMLAIYRPLSVDPASGTEPDGSLENPYTFIFGIDVINGKYYTFNGVVYLAKADMPACVWEPGTSGLWQWEAIA